MKEMLDAYNLYTKSLVAFVQAFILHHQYPDTYNCPDLDEARVVWERANNFNADMHTERKWQLAHYGLWSETGKRWSVDFSSGAVFYSGILCVAHANCRETNRYWQENWPKANVDWQVKIIGDDGLPVDLPED